MPRAGPRRDRDGPPRGGHGRDDPFAITGGGEDLAAEQRQRRRGRLQHGGGVAGASKRWACRPGGAPRAQRPRRVDLQRVAGTRPRHQAGSPSARRNRDTFVCSTLRPCRRPGQPRDPRSTCRCGPSHRPRGRDDQHFRRLAAPDGMHSPSRCSSTTSSTDTAITAHRVRPRLS